MGGLHALPSNICNGGEKMKSINMTSAILYLLAITFIIMKWVKMTKHGIKFWKSATFKYDVLFVIFCLAMAINQVVTILCAKN